MAGVFDLIRWPSRREQPIPRADPMSLEVIEAKAILGEVFDIRPEEVEEMVRARVGEIAARVQSMS
jgi:hypothetical protein